MNLLNANATKWSNTLKLTNCLRVFDHVVGLAFRGFSSYTPIPLVVFGRFREKDDF